MKPYKEQRTAGCKSQLSSCRKHFFSEVKAKLCRLFVCCLFVLDSSTWQVKVERGRIHYWYVRNQNRQEKTTWPRVEANRKGLRAVVASGQPGQDDSHARVWRQRHLLVELLKIKFLKAVNHERTAVQWEHKVDMRPQTGTSQEKVAQRYFSS